MKKWRKARINIDGELHSHICHWNDKKCGKFTSMYIIDKYCPIHDRVIRSKND